MKQTKREVTGEPIEGLTRKKILEEIKRSGKRGLSIYELSWYIGADIINILGILKELQKHHLISVRVRYAVHWCYPLRGVA